MRRGRRLVSEYNNNEYRKTTMAAQRRLAVCTLAVVLVAAQPVQAHQWELVTEGQSNAPAKVPDYKPVQELSILEANGSGEEAETKSTVESLDISQEHYRTRDDKLLENQVEITAETDRIIERNNQEPLLLVGQDDKSNKADKRNLEPMKASTITRKEESPKASQLTNLGQHINGVDKRVNSQSEVTLIIDRIEETKELQWELVIQEKVEPTKLQDHEDSIVNTVVWERVPYGEELMENDIIAKLEDERARRDEIAVKIDRELEFEKKLNWFSRIVKSLRRNTSSEAVETKNLEEVAREEKSSISLEKQTIVEVYTTKSLGQSQQAANRETMRVMPMNHDWNEAEEKQDMPVIALLVEELDINTQIEITEYDQSKNKTRMFGNEFGLNELNSKRVGATIGIVRISF